MKEWEIASKQLEAEGKVSIALFTFSSQFDIILFADETYAYKARYMDNILLLATKVVMEADTYMDLGHHPG